VQRVAQKKISETLRVGWLIDGSGGAVRQNVRIRISGGLVDAIEPAAAPAGEALKETDLSDYTVLPCLVDSHVHLFMSGTADMAVRKAQLDAPFEAAAPVIAAHIAASFRCGITAVRDGGDHYGHTLRFRDECLAALKLPFRLQAAGRAWHRPDRYGRLIGRVPDPGRSLAEAIAAETAGIDHVKIVNSGLNSLLKFGRQTPPQFSLEELRAAVAAAHAGGLSVMVHANGKVPVSIAIEAGCRSIEHGFFMGKENLKKMADRGIFWIPTAGTMKAYADHWERIGENADVTRRNLEHQLEQIAAARDLGVVITVGTDAGSLGVDHGRGIVQELKMLQLAGLSIQEAIRCAAYNGAKLLDLPDPRLAHGLPATFMAAKGSPARLPESLPAIERIWIDGALFDLGGRGADDGSKSDDL